MTLSQELEIVLKELESKGIKYPDPMYKRVKMVKTTLDGIQWQIIGVKR